MKNVKNNNKGFSLVELIVVVLIMAILAVSLAPQVMKWVENSREASDIQTADSIVAACQITAASKTPGTAASITLSGKGSKTIQDDATSPSADVSAFWTAVQGNLGASAVTIKSSNTNIKIDVTSNGAVTMTNNHTNTDLN